jgi:16S rRNA C967 or C1407 C5-methylase (RsmB/RsmF family)/NOL1/NOP2/fmu family ribosome biogenesis protein
MMKHKKQRPPSSPGPPAAFLAKMEHLLGDEYGAFAQSYEAEERVGLRVNTLKISAADFIKKSPFTLSPVGEHEPAGFLVTDEGQRSRPGSHPYHAAGLYYLQEPAAMVVGSLAQPQPGELVLDLAAAPGGKATHLATLMGDRGLLVANDIHAGRVRLLAENLERWGVRQTLITNDTPERLAATFGPIFDKVVLDAPCSGEGMFRRQGEFEWSEAIVAACARRQTAILPAAAALVRPGGLLVYATCTFSPEEDEEVIVRFLGEHEEYELVEPPHYGGFSAGRPEWIRPSLLPAAQQRRLRYSVRLWPHRFPGEGHFIACLRRQETVGQDQPKGYLRLWNPHRPSLLEQQVWREFVSHTLQISLPEERLHAVNGRLYLLPEGALDTASLKIVRYGLLLGEVRKDYFRPAHTLAMSLSPSEVKATANWAADEAAIRAYLSGHDLSFDGPDGWVLVTVDGYALGWGKRVSGRLKNHYPRGLRR